jgi:pyruvate/2-oxoglutarate dehydrogenase complex dihydrolipoamide acyltransferase (E2) component
MGNLNLAGLLITLIIFLEFTKNTKHSNLIAMKGGQKNNSGVKEESDDEDEESKGWGYMSYVLFGTPVLILLVMIGYFLYIYLVGSTDNISAEDPLNASATAATNAAATNAAATNATAATAATNAAATNAAATAATTTAPDEVFSSVNSTDSQQPEAASVLDFAEGIGSDNIITTDSVDKTLPPPPDVGQPIDADGSGQDLGPAPDIGMMGGTIAKLKKQLRSFKKK